MEVENCHPKDGQQMTLKPLIQESGYQKKMFNGWNFVYKQPV